MLREWNELPHYMKTKAVLPYYKELEKKKTFLKWKRIFDFIVSLMMLLILFPLGLILSIAITMDSRGNVFFRQERITQYGRKFRIIKFRTMIADAEKYGSQITVSNDMRVTKVGKILRKYRLDELPQLINILLGDMSFVGPRPEVTRYVKKYTPEWIATLLMPAGVTSEASIIFKDENRFLEGINNIEFIYMNELLPEKMKYNLEYAKKFSFWEDIRIMAKTLIEVIK